MGRHVDKKFVVFIVHSYYLDRKSHHFFCSCSLFLQSLLDEMNKLGFYELNKGHKKWFVIFQKSDWRVTLFLVLI